MASPCWWIDKRAGPPYPVYTTGSNPHHVSDDVEETGSLDVMGRQLNLSGTSRAALGSAASSQTGSPKCLFSSEIRFNLRIRADLVLFRT